MPEQGIPHVVLHQSCNTCNTDPMVLLFPVRMGMRAGKYEIRGVCESCGDATRFMSTVDFPKEYPPELTRERTKVTTQVIVNPPVKQQRQQPVRRNVSVGSNGALTYQGQVLGFRSGKAYTAAKRLIDEGRVTYRELDNIFGRHSTPKQYRDWLNARGLQGYLIETGDGIALRGYKYRKSKKNYTIIFKSWEEQ